MPCGIQVLNYNKENHIVSVMLASAQKQLWLFFYDASKNVPKVEISFRPASQSQILKGGIVLS